MIATGTRLPSANAPIHSRDFDCNFLIATAFREAIDHHNPIAKTAYSTA